MKAVLGIDTSCYTTSCALVDARLQVVASLRQMLPVSLGECGLRQSEAVFAHVRQLPLLLEQLAPSMQQVELAGVCAAEKPLDAANSYMPVFVAGTGFARGLAACLHIPYVGTSHQQGHISAAQIGLAPLPPDFLAVHLSGGTTQVLHHQADGTLLPLAETLDISAGQLIDRVGVRMGMPFPSGPHMEETARRGKSQGRLKAIVSKDGCHFSGAEAAALRMVEAGAAHEDVAAEVFDVIVRTILKMLSLAQEQTGLDTALVAGGVASSQLLRQGLSQRNEKRRLGIQLCFGAPQYAGDNAAGVARLGALQLLTNQ